MMEGTRVADRQPDEGLMEPGEYGRLQHPDGSWHWYACTPNGLHANLSGHSVTEHEGGSISVEPSILVTGGVEGGWHGYLRDGVWVGV